MLKSLNLKSLLVFALAGCFPYSAFAHATVQPRQAVQDSYQRLAVGVTHGCEGSATTQVIVTIPESLMGAKPMPKSGWTLETEIRELSTPYFSHGKEIKRDVRVIIWKGGRLLDEHFDEFVIQVKVWNKQGAIFLPVTQLCEEGRLDWNQLPDAEGKKLMFPAPMLEVLPGLHAHH